MHITVEIVKFCYCAGVTNYTLYYICSNCACIVFTVQPLMQEARVWAGSAPKNEVLDYSEKSDGVRGASDADSGAESVNMQQKSLVDLAEDFDSDDSDEVSK